MVYELLAIIQGNKVEMFSRNGKQFHNFPHIIEELETVLTGSPCAIPTCVRWRGNEC